MNGSYGYLNEENTDDNEITNDKELRKIKKKLRNLKQKGDIEGSRKLEILINEYVNLNKSVDIKKTKKNKNNKSQNNKDKDNDSFLEKEYQKNKEMNAKKYAEQERKKYAEQEQRGYNCDSQSDTDKLIQDHGLKKTNLPPDILEIISDYSHVLWKKLSLKYHPDKYEGSDTYSKLLNCMKDNH